MKHFIIFLHLFQISILALNAASTITCSTRVQPSTFSPNERAYLVVTANQLIHGATFELPSSPDIHLRYESQSAQTRYVNGVMEQSTSWFFQLTVKHEGTFTIPNFQGTSQGQTFDVPSTTFTITKSTVNSPKTAANSSSSTPIMRLILAGELPQTWYVGQSVPVQLQLITSPNLRGQLTNFPQKIGDTFSASHLVENPQKTTLNIQGNNFPCLYWPTLLTPLTSGQVKLSFSVDLEIERSVQPKNFFDSDDPLNLLTQSLNGMFSRTEPVTIKSIPQTIQILPLPQPQPSSFNQAIGNFQLTSPKIVENELVQDEPITLLIKVTGTGNFENIHAPQLVYDASQWRTYEPTSNFESKDFLGFEGELNYKYMLVPLVSGNVTLPKTIFTFLNPKQGKYETLERGFSPNTLYVKPALHASTHDITAPSTSAKTTQKPTHNAIFIDKVVWESNTSTFYFVQLLLGISTVIFLVIAWRHYYITHSPTYETKKIHKQQLRTFYKNLQVAFHNKNGLEFYNAIYQLIELLLKNKHLAWNDIFNNDQRITLSNDEKDLLKKIENFYQESKFGRSHFDCPTDLLPFKKLIHTLK